MADQTQEYLVFLQDIADDAMGMEPGDRLVIADIIKHFGEGADKIKRLRRALDDIKIRAYEMGNKVLHDQALEALRNN